MYGLEAYQFEWPDVCLAYIVVIEKKSMLKSLLIVVQSITFFLVWLGSILEEGPVYNLVLVAFSFGS